MTSVLPSIQSFIYIPLTMMKNHEKTAQHQINDSISLHLFSTMHSNAYTTPTWTMESPMMDAQWTDYSMHEIRQETFDDTNFCAPLMSPVDFFSSSLSNAGAFRDCLNLR